MNHKFVIVSRDTRTAIDRLIEKGKQIGKKDLARVAQAKSEVNPAAKVVVKVRPAEQLRAQERKAVREVERELKSKKAAAAKDPRTLTTRQLTDTPVDRSKKVQPATKPIASAKPEKKATWQRVHSFHTLVQPDIIEDVLVDLRDFTNINKDVHKVLMPLKPHIELEGTSGEAHRIILRLDCDRRAYERAADTFAELDRFVQWSIAGNTKYPEFMSPGEGETPRDIQKAVLEAGISIHAEEPEEEEKPAKKQAVKKNGKNASALLSNPNRQHILTVIRPLNKAKTVASRLNKDCKDRAKVTAAANGALFMKSTTGRALSQSFVDGMKKKAQALK